MRRKLAFSGFITATCITALLSFVMFIALIYLINILSIIVNEAERTAGMLATIIMAITVLFSIACLILNSCSISSTTTAQKMNKRKGLVITSIVFNFIVIFFLLAVSVENGATAVFYIICMLGLIASNVLILIDVARLSKAVNAELFAENNIVTEEKIENPIEEIKIEGNSQPKNKEMDDLESELNKLMLMKEKNLITEEEFEQLKKRAIDKKLSK